MSPDLHVPHLSLDMQYVPRTGDVNVFVARDARGAIADGAGAPRQERPLNSSTSVDSRRDAAPLASRTPAP
jgi:hypothetical protein